MLLIQPSEVAEVGWWGVPAHQGGREEEWPVLAEWLGQGPPQPSGEAATGSCPSPVDLQGK